MSEYDLLRQSLHMQHTQHVSTPLRIFEPNIVHNPITRMGMWTPRGWRQYKAVYIPALGGMPEVHEQWTISEWARRVAIQRKIGCDGIIVYRFNGFDTAVAVFFGNGPFFGTATFPPPKK